MKISGIIGVIVITFIVIFIAAITFAHVESIREEQNQKKDQSIQGTITSIQQNSTIKLDKETVSFWTVTLTDRETSESTQYQMIFKGTYPPHQGLDLRFYYSKIMKDNSEYLLISQIEQVETS
ncbi:MAG: hypothetical protein KGY65_09165 [Candidatus Thermoplasmatota archaeon]|nr:hypothetical protein [Candidatus Thermoplasmatota archaeon]